jgi:hypothetical protein
MLVAFSQSLYYYIKECERGHGTERREISDTAHPNMKANAKARENDKEKGSRKGPR